MQNIKVDEALWASSMLLEGIYRSVGSLPAATQSRPASE
ncbi:hypothetical protein X726_31755 [Mesorhizobium sp. L103C105A0]|nr:hypothetical protein X726_31755 [Mesorhizobium sp. L103C105A0]